jgi:hypothetical protein
MREIGIRLRALVGALPVGFERAWQRAVGPPSDWAWIPTAIPWVLALIVAVLVAALSYLALRIAADSLPMASVWLAAAAALFVAIAQGAVARRSSAVLLRTSAIVLAGLGGGALGSWAAVELVQLSVVASLAAGVACGAAVLLRRLTVTETARAASQGLRPVTVLISILFLLAVLPLLQAGAELIVNRSTVNDFVDRRTGFSRTLVEMPGYALLVPFAAEAPATAAADRLNDYMWLVLRDEPRSTKVGLVRTARDPALLSERSVLARVAIVPGAPDEAMAGVRARGYDPPRPIPDLVLQELTLEAARGVDGRSVGSVGDLAGLPDGTVVRITLRFDGIGIATCVASETCDPHRLAGGIGPWDQVARQPGGDAAVVVRTPYPPSLAPIRVFGRQISGGDLVERFVSLPSTAPFLGWAQVLRAAIIDRDPSLPVDRLWLAPILFVVAALVLLLGLRIGYPIFRSADQAPILDPPAVPVAGRATGRIAPPGQRPVDLDRAAVRLRLEDGLPTLDLPAADGATSVTVPRALGALSSVDVGELRFVRRRRPAIATGWYGSSLLLEFETDGDRDAAAAVLRRFRDPVGQ